MTKQTTSTLTTATLENGVIRQETAIKGVIIGATLVGEKVVSTVSWFGDTQKGDYFGLIQGLVDMVISDPSFKADLLSEHLQNMNRFLSHIEQTLLQYLESGPQPLNGGETENKSYSVTIQKGDKSVTICADSILAAYLPGEQHLSRNLMSKGIEELDVASSIAAAIAESMHTSQKDRKEAVDQETMLFEAIDFVSSLRAVSLIKLKERIAKG